MMKNAMRVCLRGVVLSAAWLQVGGLLADGHLTVFNSHALMKFEKTALQVRRFDVSSQEKLTEDQVRRISEALDNSRLVCFGSEFDTKRSSSLYKVLFDSAPICQSMGNFLSRGGLVYFSPMTYAELQSWPATMKSFFLKRGVHLPNGGNCIDTSKNPSSERIVEGVISPAFRKTLFDGPRDCGPMRAIRHFGKLTPEWQTIYVSKEDGDPLMVLADCAGGGRIVFSHVYIVDRQASSPFYLNLIEGAYGADAVRLRSSRAAYVDDARQRGLKGICIRRLPSFTKVFPDSRLPDPVGVELEEIDLTLARNDREVVQLALYNCSDENVVFRLEPDPKDPMHDFFAFYDVMPWMGTNGQIYDEIVTEPSAGLVSVPSGETKVLLLAAKTDRAPGTYSWSFSFVPVNNGEMEIRTVRVKAEVLNLRLEEKDLPPVYTWGPYQPCVMGFAGCDVRECWDFLAQSHVSIMQINNGPLAAVTKGADGRILLSDDEKDYLSCEKDLMVRGLKWVYGYGVVELFLKRAKSLGLEDDFENPKTKGLFVEWCRRWAKALRKSGVDFNQFWISPVDEPRAKQIGWLVQGARLMRAEGFRIAVSLATWSTREDLEALRDVVDLWWPWEDRFRYRPATRDGELAFYRETGKPVITYLCSVSCAFQPYQDYFRYRGIRTFLLGADGFGMWAANSWRGNDYYSPHDTAKYSSFLFHHGRKPVGTIRLEAFREGIEDLYWLRRAADSSRPEVLRLSSRPVLEDLLAVENPEKIGAWRNGLLRALVR